MPLDFVKAEARHGVEVAVAFDRATVNIVVAESAEVEIRGSDGTVATRGTTHGPQPDRGVRHRQINAKIETTPKLRDGGGFDACHATYRVPREALFIIHCANRASQVGIKEPGFSRRQAVKGCANVLCVGQRVDLVEQRKIVLSGQTPWFVPDQQVLVTKARRIALSTALSWPKHVVEIRTVPRQRCLPSQVFARNFYVSAFVAWQLGRGCVGGGDTDFGESERIGNIQLVANASGTLVALQDRMRIVDSEMLKRKPLAPPDHQLLIVDPAGRRYLPGGHDGMLID